MHVEMGRHNDISKKSFSWVAQRWGNKGAEEDEDEEGHLFSCNARAEARGEWF